MTEKKTSGHAASASSNVLQDGRTSSDSKSAAGSALAQAGKGGTGKSTGDKAASSASDTLQNDSTGAKSKTAAASALSQKK